MLEATLQRAIVKELRRYGCEVIFVPNENAGNVGYEDGLMPGCPDLIVSGKNGEIVFLEVKTGTNSLQANQKKAHETLKRCGHKVCVVRDVKAALWACRRFLDEAIRRKLEFKKMQAEWKKAMHELGGESQSDEVKRIKSALSVCPADGYSLWVRFGLALYDWDPFEGFGIWDEWSRTSPRYDPTETEAKWNRAIMGYNSKLDIDYIFYIARGKYGWNG